MTARSVKGLMTVVKLFRVIAEVKESVQQQGDDLDNVKNEVSEQGQRLDQVEETVDDTVTKVQEIDSNVCALMTVVKLCVL